MTPQPPVRRARPGTRPAEPETAPVLGIIAATLLVAAGCAEPERPVTVVRAAEPDTPALAQQQGIFGTVEIAVDVAADGSVGRVRVVRSPSPILNAAALSAARNSTYRPALHGCAPAPATFLFSVHFADPATESAVRVNARGETEAVVHTTATVLRPPDSVWLDAILVTRGATEAEARAANDATLAQIAHETDGLATTQSISGPDTTRATVTPPASDASSPPQAYVVRDLAVRVARFDDVAQVVRILDAHEAGATSAYWSLRAPSDAQREARDAALRRAHDEADTLARARGLRVMGVRHVEVQPQRPPIFSTMAQRYREAPPQVPVEATITVTYLLAR